MAEIIRMPRLSDTMEEGNIVGWLKSVGDSVEPGDVLAEVETDKATMELESFQSGTLLYIGQKEGAVPVDGIIAVIGEKGEDFQAQLKAAQAEGGGTKEVKEEESKAESVEEKPAAKADAPKPEPKPAVAQQAPAAVPASNDNGRIKASPLAKSLASKAGVSIGSISGSGEGGRVVKKDVEAFIASGGASAASSSVSAPAISQESAVQYGDVPVSQMRKVIARRLGESKFTAPHFYLTVEINMGKAIEARKDLKENDIKVSFNDFVVKASAMALKKHPSINSSWNGDTISVHQDVNIGVAVAVPDGLLVPVIRNADHKSMTYINQEVRTLAGKAKDKKLQPDEMQGNTFTISNLGMFGIEEFTAIINTPDSCILAVGSIIEKPIVKSGQIVPGNMMKVTLSCDHRVVDGASGAMFLQTLKGMLENPVMMIA